MRKITMRIRGKQAQHIIQLLANRECRPSQRRFCSIPSTGNSRTSERTTRVKLFTNAYHAPKSKLDMALFFYKKYKIKKQKQKYDFKNKTLLYVLFCHVAKKYTALCFYSKPILFQILI